MGDFRNLEVWRRAHQLSLAAYRAARTLPKSEQYELGSQLRRAAISISANIAEGCGRNGDREMSRFLRISLGSASELQCLLILARDLQLIDADLTIDLEREAIGIARMLAGLDRRLRQATPRKTAASRPTLRPRGKRADSL